MVSININFSLFKLLIYYFNLLFSLRWDCAEAWAESYINTDVFLEPVKFFNDPFYAGKNNKLVLCESYCHDKSVASNLINFNYI